jgi:ankyrin repeat protein
MKGNDLKAVRAFIKRDTDVNSADDEGYTPLHWAAENGFVPFAKLLLSKGADPGAATRDGWTPLDLAKTEGHTEMEALLSGSPARSEKKKPVKPLKKKT